MTQRAIWSRRRLLGTIVAAGGAALAGCDARPGAEPGPSETAKSAATDTGKALLVYRDPECGCCKAWAEIARTAGYAVTVENRADMAAVKARYGVPADLASCHTAIVAGYAIEGHVPMPHIARLLRERPDAVKGLAVPGMPRGSPGMEMPDGSKDDFEVMAFDAEGRATVFSA